MRTRRLLRDIRRIWKLLRDTRKTQTPGGNRLFRDTRKTWRLLRDTRLNTQQQAPSVPGPELLLSLCSKYQVVVEEERPRRLRRGAAEILRCYPVPVHFQNTTLLDSQYYFSAELPTSELRGATPFCVGGSLVRQTDRQSVRQSVR